jgi:hypothetical protein
LDNAKLFQYRAGLSGEENGMKEFKFEIGNSTDGEIGAVFYVKAETESAARETRKKFIGDYGEPLRDSDGDVECLVYFGNDELIAATKGVEEVE